MSQIVDISSITLWAVWKEVIPTTMQNFGSYCNRMIVGATINLLDTRDNTTYTIAKLQDNKCWMTQNLTIGSKGQITLTQYDSDLNNNMTIYNTSYAGYYSWSTATGGNDPSYGSASTSICPKGWRMPSDSDYDTLKNYYSYYSIQSTPANFSLSGWVYHYSSPYGGSYSPEMRNSGQYGLYWSSSTYRNVAGNFLAITDSGWQVNCVQYNYAEMPVRCIAR